MGRRVAIGLALFVGLLVIVGAGTWLWMWHNGRESRAVSQDEALAHFRRAHLVEPQVALPRVPRVGVYTFAQQGHESGGLGPFAIDRSLPSDAQYTITLTDGGFQEELALAAEHIEAVRYRVFSDGARRAVWRRTEVTFAGVGRDDRRDLKPPPLELPARLAVGQRWSARYHAGSLSVSSVSEVLRRVSVTVDGKPEPTFLIRTVGDTRGAHDSHRVDRVWWSPRLRIPVRWTIDMAVRGIVRLDTHSELRLRSATPKT